MLETTRDNRSLSERMGLADPNKRILPLNEGDAPGPVVGREETNAGGGPSIINPKSINLTEDAKETYYLESTFPGLGGFFGQTQKRFKFQGNYWNGSLEDRDYIVKHYSKFVHEISNPQER